MLYEDAAGTNVIRAFTNKTQMHTLTHSGSRMWVSVENASSVSGSANSRDLVKYRLTVSPLTPSFGLAMWMSDFLLQSCKSNASSSSDDSVSDEANKRTETILVSVFNALVTYAYSCEFPTPMKEEVFSMLARVVRAATAASPTVSLPWKRLLRLKEEMVNLQGQDKKRQNLVPSYLQNLVEVMTTAHEPLVQIAAEESKQEAEAAKGNKIVDEDLSVAIAIATTLQNTLKSTEDVGVEEVVQTTNTVPTPAPSSPTAAPPAAPPVTQSAQVAPTPAPEPTSPVPKPSQPSAEVGEDEPNEETYEDDELAAAIAASMQTSSAEKPAEPTSEKQESKQGENEAVSDVNKEKKDDEKTSEEPAESEKKDSTAQGPDATTKEPELKPSSIEQIPKTNEDESMDAGEEDYDEDGEGDVSMDDDLSAAIAASLRAGDAAASAGGEGGDDGDSGDGDDMDDEMSAALALSMQSHPSEGGNDDDDDDDDDDSDSNEDDDEDEDSKHNKPNVPATPAPDPSLPSTPAQSQPQGTSPPPVRTRIVRRRYSLCVMCLPVVLK